MYEFDLRPRHLKGRIIDGWSDSGGNLRSLHFLCFCHRDCLESSTFLTEDTIAITPKTNGTTFPYYPILHTVKTSMGKGTHFGLSPILAEFQHLSPFQTPCQCTQQCLHMFRMCQSIFTLSSDLGCQVYSSEKPQRWASKTWLPSRVPRVPLHHTALQIILWAKCLN